MVLIFPICAFIIALGLSFLLIRQQMRWAVICLMIGCIAVFAWAIWRGEQAQGWDGIGYAIIAILGCIPAFLGAAVGWLIGWMRNRKERARLAAAPPPE